VTEPRLAGAGWRRDPGLAKVFDALEAAGGEARVVGGGVRDSLLGRPTADLDLGTTLTPDRVVGALEAAGLKAVPTGIAHGTVTAVADHAGYEVTTLRRDVATDGRHAEVAFSLDWREDAARRDFTINAMSADRAGRLYDYFGGADDLAARRVRFVGDAGERVREDYLRILRFFRFHAWYAAGPPDAAGLAAARAGVDGLARVSAERVRQELVRLLAAPDPTPTVEAMVEAGVAEAVLGELPRPLAPLAVVEASAGAPPDPILRLAALAPSPGLAERLKLSRREAAALTGFIAEDAPLGADGPARRRALYALGADAYRGRAMLAAAYGGEAAELPARLAEAAAWPAPAFPLKGRDLIEFGAEKGPELGRLLAELEAFWVAQDFASDRAALLLEARRRLEHSEGDGS